MSLVVTFVGATITDAESITGWDDGALDPAKFYQNANAVGWYAAKNSRSSITYTLGTSQSWTTGDHLYTTAQCDVLALAEAQSTGTTTASGFTVRVTLANAAYREWHVAGSDTWDGGWRQFVIDLGHTGTHLYASSGTFSSASNIDSVTWYYDLSNSGNIRNVPANVWQDVTRVGSGLQVHNTSAADASIDYAAIAAIDNAVANRYGVLFPLDPGAESLGCEGKLILGDSASTNHLDFDSQGETVEMLERDGTDGYGLVADGLYGVEVVANSTGTDQDFSMGIKVGTGADASGRGGTKISAGGPNVVWYFDSSDADLHNFTMYGCTFQGAVGGVTYGVELDSPTTTFEVAGSTYDGCESTVTADAVVTNHVWVNSTTDATTGALVWQDGETDIENCSFINNVNGVYIGTLSANITLTGMTWAGNTYDIEYEHTADRDANYDGTAPSINNTSTGTLTAVSSKTATFTPVENDAGFTITKVSPDFTEEFTGTNSDPWDSGDWTTDVVASGAVDIQSNAGRMVTNATGSDWANAENTSVTPVQDQEILFSCDPQSQSANRMFIIVYARMVSTGWTTTPGQPATSYKLLVRTDSDEEGHHLERRLSGNEVSLVGGDSDPQANSRSDFGKFWVRWRMFDSGTSVIHRARIWSDGDTEPTTWDLSYTDTAPGALLGADGGFGFRTFQASETGGATCDNRLDDIEWGSYNEVLKDVASTTGGEVVYTYDGALDGTAATVHIIIAGKEPIDFPWTIAEGTVPVSQVTDRIYSNP